MVKDYEYEKNIGHHVQCPSEEREDIKCKNYELCNSIVSQWWFNYKKNNLCIDCHCMFGTWGNGGYKHEGKGVLEIKNNIDCPVCLETKKRGVSYPRCNHFVCTKCFKKCFSLKDQENPSFPYPDIKSDYYQDPSNPKWDDYPLIKTFNDELNRPDYTQKEEYKRLTYLHRCPLCRK